MLDLRLQCGVRHEPALELGHDDRGLKDQRSVALLMHEVATPRTAQAGAAARIRLDDVIRHIRYVTPIPYEGQEGSWSTHPRFWVPRHQARRSEGVFSRTRSALQHLVNKGRRR